MKFLHTSDWHLGQQFYHYDRTYEHRRFLEWLLAVLKEEQTDVLLLSGDVFDVSNPSAVAVRMFYRFLIEAVKENPQLQIVVTAGNHDSASRLETPQPLVELMHIHIVGVVQRDEKGEIDFDKLLIPLKDRAGTTQAWCIAAPFLRMGDYPSLPDSGNPYAEGVAAFYQEALAGVRKKRTPHQAIVAMGHLHTLRAEIGDQHLVEREIMGGIEGILPSTFSDEICYVALGHIHKAQAVGGREQVRYSGSPIPMSFSEINYKHRVVLFDTQGAQMVNLRFREIPVTVPLRRVAGTLPEVLDSLAKLPPTDGKSDTAPLLEVSVLLDGPEPALRHYVEEALEGKNVRLARIDARNKQQSAATAEETPLNPEHLKEIQPVDLLQRVYRNRYDQPLPEPLQELFRRAEQEAAQNKE